MEMVSKRTVRLICIASLGIMLLMICCANYAFAGSEILLNVIPRPVEFQKTKGSFILKSSAQIFIEAEEPLVRKVADYLSEHLAVPTGYEFKVVSSMEQAEKDSDDVIIFQRADTKDRILGDEGYRLCVNPDKITIIANRPAGFFYGVQTLLQLFPSQIESRERVSAVEWKIDCVEIVDYPRFKWRGLLLDVSRHFFTKEEVKQYIDMIVRYKFNTLQLHLTDDQGWRLEIKKYPRLTEVGAWRVLRVGHEWNRCDPPGPGEKPTYGGFYTQQDIRELVNYARERFVTIVPEIDVPGHAMAILATYPNLSCTGGPFQVNPGSAFYRKIENTLCVGNDQVFDFLDGVFSEVAELFPGQYIHMGGDEAYKGFWAKCHKCQKRKAEENLKCEDELQSYFVKRVEKIVESKGKKLIGWDEILKGGLAPNATVMSWRGIGGGIRAAKMGHKVIMSPSPYYYLDLYQGDRIAEPRAYSSSRLRECYAFNPVPKEINVDMVLGVQGNLWTETVPTLRHAQYMIWPRGFAIAETGWSAIHQKDWSEFTRRVEEHFARLDEADIKYSTSMFDVIFVPKKNSTGQLEIGLDTEIQGLDIYYSFDGSNPDQHYPKYTKPLTVPPCAIDIRVVTYRNGQCLGKQITMPLSILRKRVGI